MEKIFKLFGFYKIKKPFHLFFSLVILLGGAPGFLYIAKNYHQIFSSRAYLEKNSDIEPEEQVVLEFSRPIFFDKKLEEFKISPFQKVRLNWENNKRKLIITPIDSWKIETEYFIKLPEIKSIMLTSFSEKEFTFSTIKYPRVMDFSPKEGEENVVLGIEDPMSVKFDKELNDFDLKFLVNSSGDISFLDNENFDSFNFLPNKIEENKSYMTQVLVKHKDESENKFKNIYSSSFKTAPPIESLKKDPALMLQQAKKTTKPKIAEGKYIDLNLSVQILSTFENGKIIDSYLVSSGKRGMETPKGEFKVMAKRLRPWSNKYKLFMPFFMQFTGQGHGIHELPEWPGGYKEGASHLGTPISHGCVRLGIGPAKQVYNWAEIGTPIIIY